MLSILKKKRSGTGTSDVVIYSLYILIFIVTAILFREKESALYVF